MASASPTQPPTAERQVLSTLNVDGTRRWIRPRLARGRFWRRRLVAGWALIALFTALPYVKIGGRPAILLDVAQRRFQLFGATFAATDTLLLTLLLVGIFVGIFLLTAVLGRAWCGWACPQTVYMELVYRPLERLLEGPRARQMRLDREGPDGRRVLKHAVFALVSLFLAHTFLAYFVGVEALVRWVTGPPAEHWPAFLLVAAVTALMFLDFGWFREQVCLVACPYGRLQSVLLDRRSVIVGYDPARGEPRGQPRTQAGDAPSGDCVDCSACVQVCPTGIDIRDGLQMECIHCTQCIDACDAVMDKLERPRGLIRYSSQDELVGKPRRILRPRVIVYPLLLAGVWGALGWALAARESADVTVLRGIGAPFAVLPDGEVSNQLRIKIANRGARGQSYAVELVGASDLRLVSPDLPLAVEAGASGTASVFVLAPPTAFEGGVREIALRVHDGAGFDRQQPYRLLGPQ